MIGGGFVICGEILVSVVVLLDLLTFSCFLLRFSPGAMFVIGNWSIFLAPRVPVPNLILVKLFHADQKKNCFTSHLILVKLWNISQMNIQNQGK